MKDKTTKPPGQCRTSNPHVVKWVAEMAALCQPDRVHCLEGLDDFTPEMFEQAQDLDVEEWRREIIFQDELFLKTYSNLPKELIFQRELLVSRL